MTLSPHARKRNLLIGLVSLAVIFVSTQFAFTPVTHAEPGTIRVYMTRESPPVVEPVEYQAYLRVVLPEEWYAEWHYESLRAGAVTVRTFGWWHVLNPMNPDYDLTDTTQTYIPNDPRANRPSTNQALADTAGQYLTYNNDMLHAFYDSEHSDPTISYQDYSPPVSSVADPICAGTTPWGHRHGVCQWGTSRWATGSNPNDQPFPRWDYQRMLVHYYTAIHMRDATDTVITPFYRWNPLQINWGTSDNRPPVMCRTSTYPVTIQVQNTGIYDWSPSGQWGLSYRWTKPGFVMYSNNRSWINVEVPRGNPPYTFALNINDIPNWGPGTYTLQFDMIDYRWGYEKWFKDSYHWPTYDVSVYVDDPCYFLPVLMKNYAGW